MAGLHAALADPDTGAGSSGFCAPSRIRFHRQRHAGSGGTLRAPQGTDQLGGFRPARRLQSQSFDGSSMNHEGDRRDAPHLARRRSAGVSTHARDQVYTMAIRAAPGADAGQGRPVGIFGGRPAAAVVAALFRSEGGRRSARAPTTARSPPSQIRFANLTSRKGEVQERVRGFVEGVTARAEAQYLAGFLGGGEFAARSSRTRTPFARAALDGAITPFFRDIVLEADADMAAEHQAVASAGYRCGRGRRPPRRHPWQQRLRIGSVSTEALKPNAPHDDLEERRALEAALAKRSWASGCRPSRRPQARLDAGTVDLVRHDGDVLGRVDDHRVRKLVLRSSVAISGFKRR